MTALCAAAHSPWAPVGPLDQSGGELGGQGHAPTSSGGRPVRYHTVPASAVEV